MVEIKGLEKFAPKDFPGVLTCTVFLGSCNFRCPYCHNADLVLNPESLPTFPMDYFIDFLDSRKDWLEGVCVTGGEPLIHKDLEDFLSVLKERRLLVKLDTNGSFPSRLSALIQKDLLDSVAMDVKAPLEKYRDVTKSSVNPEDIQKSIEIIMNSSVEYMFRTTVVPGLVEAEDIIKMGQMLKGAKVFQIQQFSPHNTLEPSFEQKNPFPEKEIQAMAEAAKEFFSEVRFEGI
ncbi:MAG: anaerobic ribonucleoside-triphosphate reductase activating protein [Candidatus Aminicenantes bacterium]|nr:anaerobic ribonucleoside-triphosphate reductase activating protein [Candidatus Aminicenantes bacterium]MDH5383782.1 anaerobic ribonucleoside-triphosphate reductase activating protein [Candidatus Aminicenantes bacterium]MDH5743082.1 anaerobic ribonucleoside-triphosphate reductase activating protein [Candidatus Aminicenantes bacterium]